MTWFVSEQHGPSGEGDKEQREFHMAMVELWMKLESYTHRQKRKNRAAQI
jgi:hypothetical protein